MHKRTVEQIMRVRKATAECKAVCEEATAAFRSTNPMRQPRDPEIVALCQPVKFQTMFGGPLGNPDDGNGISRGDQRHASG